MVDRQILLRELQNLLGRLEADLLERSESSDVPDVGRQLKTEFDRAQQAHRTAEGYEEWRSDAITQAAAAWVLSCVFVRFLEDNRLIDPPKIAGSSERLKQARDEHEIYFRANPSHTDRDYLLAVFDQLLKLPGGREIFGEHNPVHELPNWLSGDAAEELLNFFQQIDADTGTLVHDFTDPPASDGRGWDTRFLGDLYQDLSEAARKKYALLQTPEFVEEFILDRTLEPALNEFGLDAVPVMNREGQPVTESGFRIIDPACGSGHFLLGSFRRILDRWQRKEPGTNVRELVQRTLDTIHGVDVNPYAVAIARFRMLLAAMRACGISRLADAPAFHLNVVCGDSLLHAPVRHGGDTAALPLFEVPDVPDFAHTYAAEDLPALRRILKEGQYHAVVANPPYITPKDRALNEAYRKRYRTCHRQYSLAVPFLERIFRLAVEGGYTGQITANSFMKREFGKKLIEAFFPTVDLTHVIDTSGGGGGAHIPGHKTGTVILFGRHRKPMTTTIRCVMGIRGEPSTPNDPAKGLVWLAITKQLDQPGSQSEFVSVADSPRERFHQHPWSIGGGGAAELKQVIDDSAEYLLRTLGAEPGIASWAGIDETYVLPATTAQRMKWEVRVVRPFVSGDVIRDWVTAPQEVAACPYDEHGKLLPIDQLTHCTRTWWTFRSHLRARVLIGGKTFEEQGIAYYGWVRMIAQRYQGGSRLAFSFIATHNHFVLDRGGNVFNRHAPIVTLPNGASEGDHLSLLGLLNSAAACFWMKQVFYPRATSSGDISIEKGKPEANRYEFAVTGLERFPIPFRLQSVEAESIHRIAAELDAAATRLQTALPDAILRNWQHGDFSRLPVALQQGKHSYSETRERMIALQEELDWESYRAFGLSKEGASDDVLNDKKHGIPVDARPFVWQTDVAPGAVPESWRNIYELRRRLLRSTKELAVIEDADYKRPWWGRQGVYGRFSRDYESWTSEALTRWLLDRLESYFDFDGRMSNAGSPTAKLEVSLVSVAKLADVARQDVEFLKVGELYRNDPAFDVQALVFELVAAESVPLLPVLRYKPSGLRKRAEWEKTWELQRQEDAIDARTQLTSTDAQFMTGDAASKLKREQIAGTPVPPKYDSKDFVDGNFWRLRGKLDVPKERWTSFPHCEGPDGTPVIAWAGYDHLQLATAIGQYYQRVKDEFGGSEDPRLVPLLACLIELLPWLKQWHNQVNPEYGVPMGDYFEGFLQEESRQMAKTLEEIKAWTPPARMKGRERNRT